MTQYMHFIDCSCQQQDTPPGAANSYAQWAGPTLLTARDESMPLMGRAAVTIFRPVDSRTYRRVKVDLSI